MHTQKFKSPHPGAIIIAIHNFTNQSIVISGKIKQNKKSYYYSHIHYNTKSLQDTRREDVYIYTICTVENYIQSMEDKSGKNVDKYIYITVNHGIIIQVYS